MMSCPSWHLLKLHLLNVLETEQSKEVERHLENCSTCQTQAEEIRANITEFQGDKDRLWADLQERIEQQEQGREPSRWSRLRGPALALSAAAAVVLALVLLIPDSTRQHIPQKDRPPPVTAKGTLTVQVVARRGDHQFEVDTGQNLWEGDELRFTVSVSHRGYLTVFSVDSRKVVSPFYPSSRPQQDPGPLELGRPGKTTLPRSIVLDDALGREHLVCVFSRHSFLRKQVHAAVLGLIRTRGPKAVDARALGITGAVKVITIVKVNGEGQ